MVSQKKAEGFDFVFGCVGAVDNPRCFLAPYTKLFLLQALDVWAMGVTLYCFVFGQVTGWVVLPAEGRWAAPVGGQYLVIEFTTVRPECE